MTSLAITKEREPHLSKKKAQYVLDLFDGKPICVNNFAAYNGACDDFYSKHGKLMLKFAFEQLKPIREYPYPIHDYFYNTNNKIEKYTKAITPSADPCEYSFWAVCECVMYRHEYDTHKRFLNADKSDYKNKKFTLNGFKDANFERFVNFESHDRRVLDHRTLTLLRMYDSRMFPEVEGEIEQMLDCFATEKTPEYVTN